MVVAEIPYSILCAVAFFVCIYFPSGMDSAPDRAGYQFFIILICEMFSVSLAQMVAALTPNFFIASLLNPFIIIIFALFVRSLFRVFIYMSNNLHSAVSQSPSPISPVSGVHGFISLILSLGLSVEWS
jgi:ABC-type multidrug transport system permease subunit